MSELYEACEAIALALAVAIDEADENDTVRIETSGAKARALMAAIERASQPKDGK